MNTEYSKKILFGPLLLMYVSIPIIHDIGRYYSTYRIGEWLTISIIYAIELVAAGPLLIWLCKFERRIIKFRSLLMMRIIFCYFIMVIPVIAFWDDSTLLYISLPAAILVSVPIMAARRNKKNRLQYVMMDKDTGNAYRLSSGMLMKVEVSDMSEMNSMKKLGGIYIQEFESSKINGFDNSAAMMPLAIYPTLMEFAKQDATHGVEYNHQSANDLFGRGGLDNYNNTFINPTSGAPMTGGISGIDTTGHTWASGSNESINNSSSFDPTRGY